MAEPIGATTVIGTTLSSSPTSVMSVGLTTLFIGWFGQAGAEVMLIILAAVAGCSIGLSGQNKSFIESTIFIVRGILVSVVLAKAISHGLVSYSPSLESPFLPTTIAFLLGFSVDKLPAYLRGITSAVAQKIRGGDPNVK